MDTRRASVRTWIFEQLAERFAAALEAMTGARPNVASADAETPASAPSGSEIRWHQTFAGAPGAVWLQIAEKDWTETGNQILSAIGMDDADAETIKSTFIEALGQTLSGIAQDLTGRLGHEVTCPPGEDSKDSVAAPWTRFTVKFEGSAPAIVEFDAAVDEMLLDSVLSADSASKNALAATAAASTPASQTFDLLLDVELPVSVSFGRAQVALKDVIKLTTGAIVELNRSVTEPVEVIVNNCVIARGEVVVVEGNFGVRIREVISRQDRLRTLN